MSRCRYRVASQVGNHLARSHHSGNVSNIDAQGKYFSIDGGEITFTGIQVNITPEQQTQVMEFAEGQEVTITGKVTDVGEIMGYSVKADKIELN